MVTSVFVTLLYLEYKSHLIFLTKTKMKAIHFIRFPLIHQFMMVFLSVFIHTSCRPGSSPNRQVLETNKKNATLMINPGQNEDSLWWNKEARKMVNQQIVSRGIKDKRVIYVMKNTPRYLFVPKSLIKAAYSDGPLLIGEGQTISQPYIVAIVTELLELKGD